MVHSMKSKWRPILIRTVVLVILAVFLDISFLLFGGEYLARQMIPPLPTIGIVTECFSQHTTLCKNINYTTGYAPQDILVQWLPPIYQNKNTDGTIVYFSENCNKSRLGLHYAYFHKKPGYACASMYTWVENTSNITYVLIQISWSVCPAIVDKYLQQTMNWYFRCNEG